MMMIKKYLKKRELSFKPTSLFYSVRVQIPSYYGAREPAEISLEFFFKSQTSSPHKNALLFQVFIFN